MSLWDRLTGRSGPGGDETEQSFQGTAQLAGFSLAHAVWSVSDGETLVPLVMHEGPNGRALIRMAMEKLEDGAAEARKWIETNPDNVRRAVAVYDGFVTLAEGKKDALVASANDYGRIRRTLEMVVPYRPKTAPGGFVVYKPKFVSRTGIDDDMNALAQAFFAGVDSHKEASKVWSRHMDQSI